MSLAVPGLSAYGDSRLTVDSYKGCYSNPLASSHGAEHLSHKQVLTPDRDPDTLSEQPVSEWVLIHEDAARQYMQMSGDDSRLMGNLSMSMSHCPPHSAPGELSMAAASEADLSVAVDATGGQRGHGEWGICRSKTFSPCDARLGTVRRPCGALSAALECPAPSPRVDGFSNECSCPAQLSPGQLIVTVFYDQTPAGGKNALGTFAPKVWRFCPNAACISSRPVGSDLPPAPAVFPIDRLARASVVEQIQLEKAGIRTQCT